VSHTRAGSRRAQFGAIGTSIAGKKETIEFLAADAKIGMALPAGKYVNEKGGT
jgi:hypothetical protein